MAQLQIKNEKCKIQNLGLRKEIRRWLAVIRGLSVVKKRGRLSPAPSVLSGCSGVERK
jgi:hypothetical protein